jgi:branched-chain amino acid transport system ATP-binding protein
LSLLEGRNIGVWFAGLAALQDVNITVRPEEILGLIGPNGAGKTTLINVLTGFQRPTRGSVHIDAEDMSGRAPEAFARRGIARTFQNARVFPDLTVTDNVRVAAVNGRRTRKRTGMSSGDILDWLGLSERASHRAGALPYGEERLLGIGRSLALEPDYVLLDEPAAGLNEHECEALTHLVRQIPGRFGCGVLLVEHNMRLVMAVSDRVHVIEYGKTIALGTPAEIKRHPEVLRAYLG